MDSYVEQCGSCIEFEDNGEYQKGWCQYYKQYFWRTGSCKDHYRNRENPSTGCYITTVVCDILGLSDNCGVLNNLRVFRDNVMQKDDSYKEMLYEYDIVGPIIAEKLSEDFNKTGNADFINSIFNFYILPSSSLISKKKYDEAVERYKEMIEDLREYYKIPKPSDISEDYNSSLGGHGEVKKLIKNL